jgi:NAD(P)-dependent dehydrogenase (short-subunit alcohol dehydrogenase family)
MWSKPMPLNPAFAPGRAAVITGAASGIGLAVAGRCAALGMKVLLSDVRPEPLGQAHETVAALARSPDDLATFVADVGDAAQVDGLKRYAFDTFGEVAFLMNNAAVGGHGGLFEDRANWTRILTANLWGVINGVQAFGPAMAAQAAPSVIVNTGSKQGITCPPGDTAYNVSKAGVKVVTEALAHEMRNRPGAQVSVHLLIPGWTFTGLSAAAGGPKPAGAWSAEQVADFMLEGVAKGDFYILCPDNDVQRPLDEKRIAWAAGDIIENRPALSRWHPDWKEKFEAFARS